MGYDTGDSTAIEHVLRRMAGDLQAGTEDDEFKPFEGKGFVRRDADGKLERLPFLEEKTTAESFHNANNAWKALEYHNTTHIVRPSLVPKDMPKAISLTVMQLPPDQTRGWEGSFGFSVEEANLANAAADFLMMQTDPTF